MCYTYAMEILIRKGPREDDTKLNIEEGCTLEQLAAKAGPHPYRILLARVNGADTELSEKVSDGDAVEFLDMRTHAADLVYQRSLTLIYLTAVRDVFEARGIHRMRAIIDNSLNQGFFTKIKAGADAPEETVKAAEHGVTDADVAEIEARMRDIVSQNLPIEKEYVSKDEGVRLWKEYGYPEKSELLSLVPDKEYVTAFYKIGTYRNYFFGPMVPSTGYVDLFELRKYRNGILLRFPHYEKPDVMPDYRDDFKLYEAFGEEYQWLKLLHTPYLSDMNRTIREGGAKDIILLSEALHEKKIAEIANEIKTRGKRIILIAGPSSSGKTTFARRLCIQLRVIGLQPLYMGTDDYFVNREDTPLDESGEKNYENLNALDIDLFSQNMNDLLAGKEVDIPGFDFMEGVKVFGKRITRIEKDQPIVIEGIHALNGKLTEQIDNNEKFKIYISPLTQLNIDIHNRIPTSDARMFRRMVRDYKYRGHTAAGTINEWPKVRAGENLNIFPYSGEADVVFNSTLAYETCLLKKQAQPLLEEIKPEEPEYSEAQRLLEMLRFFTEIENENDVPNNSILREFIGGSVFVE